MYYVEFFSKREGVALKDFYKHVKEDYAAWVEENPEDELLLLIGRTWRLGPKPNYIAIWKIKDMSRFDEWKKKMPSNEIMLSGVSIIENAGIYEDFGMEQL